MNVNWVGYWPQTDGYGRFNTRLVNALQRLGVGVNAYHIGDFDRPPWLFEQLHFERNRLTISCMPPYMLPQVKGRHWLYSMTEGSRIPQGWAERIVECNIERVIVPCHHNAKAFRSSGVTVPIHVVEGGTDPEEFPLLPPKQSYRPYTFLTFADRGFRKGWDETREAFYQAFGGKTTGVANVRLIVKARKGKSSALLELMKNAVGADPRVVYLLDDLEEMRELYSQAHCLVLPSRSEGWGMMHREAAASGLPVITQQYAGMDDGFTKEWALVVEGAREEEIPAEVATALGKWQIPSVDDIAQKMRYCFYSPETAAKFGRDASSWIRKNQTWQHSAEKILELIGGKTRTQDAEGRRFHMERAALPVS